MINGATSKARRAMGLACTGATLSLGMAQMQAEAQMRPSYQDTFLALRGIAPIPTHMPAYVRPGPMAAQRVAAPIALPPNILHPNTLHPSGFRQWVEFEPAYTLYPGDQIDVVVSSAPELSRTLTVGPDGRIVMPMSDPVMAAGRTFEQVRLALGDQLARQLRDPTVAVSPRAYAPEQVFVGGQVGQPGTYTLPGPIGAVETIFMAGGLRPGAKSKRIAVLRRAPDGGMMMRAVNLKGGLRDIHRYNDNIQLRRGDIVFVPRTGLAEVGDFVQQLRNVYPFDFNLSYQFGSFGDTGTTVITN